MRLQRRGDGAMRNKSRQVGLLGIVALVGLLALPTTATADVDLAVADIFVGYNGTDWEITVTVSAHYQDTHGSFSTDINLYLDGGLVANFPYGAGPYVIETCENSMPECDGVCAPILIDGNLTYGSCISWLNPADCACIYLVAYYDAEMNSGQTTCTATVDEGDQVSEADENNNSMSVAMVPIPLDHLSWSSIKALYQ